MSENILEGWPITLPTYPPEVLDNSAIETAARCPRLYLYEYGLRRGGLGINFPIGAGLAYHKYREVVETLLREEGELSDAVHREAAIAALEKYTEPPHESYYAYLTISRMLATFELARDRIRREMAAGAVEVVRTEDAFDLELPFYWCESCARTFVAPKLNGAHGKLDQPVCPHCGKVTIKKARHGGRMDQLIDWRSKMWIRDFKTTGRMGKTYPLQFDPNNQMTGYVWAGEGLSGRAFEGVLIETVYNTKAAGPEIHQFLSTRSQGQIDQWLGSMFMEHRFLREMWAEADSLGYLAFPQRTSACSDYGGCYYRKACQCDSAWQLEEWLKSETQYSEWDFTEPDKEESKQ